MNDIKKMTDIEKGRVKLDPKESAIVFDGNMKLQDYLIKKIELKRYVERLDDNLGEYSLLTVSVETDKGFIEMKYDEGFRGKDALASAVRLLADYTGLSSLINRAIIEIELSSREKTPSS
jgi:hypothetical protein